MEQIYAQLSNALQSFPSFRPSSIGSAWGANLITMVGPSAFGPNVALGLFRHEFTHCLVAAKTKVNIPAWLIEGVASCYGQNISTKDWIKGEMNLSGKPQIEKLFD